MRNNLWKRGLVFGILLMLMSTPFLIITNAEVIPGLNPDSPPLIPPNAPANCGYEDFENGVDGQQIISSLSGLTFTTTNGYLWIYGDARTGHYNLKYPNGAYTCQGNIFAWLGPQQSSGRIDFTNGDASYFSCYVSTYSGAVVDAYKDDGTFLCTSGWAQNNLNTGKMTMLSVFSSNHDIGYVIIHDSGNYWCIDRVVCDAPNVGTNQHPVPKVIVNSEYQGNNIYHFNVRLTNIGEESLNDPPSHQHGIHVQILGGELQTKNKGTFASCQDYHGSGLSDYHTLEFYVNYLDHNDEYVGSFTIKTEQGNKANIGIRAWIFDKDNSDYVYNPNTGQNEPYIARCPLEDVSSSNNKPYNQHLNDPDFSVREYKLNYYSLYQMNDFNTNYHSIWIGLGWTYSHSSSSINLLLNKLRAHSIHEIYLNIGGPDINGNYYHGGNPLLTKEQVKTNCANFMNTVNQYNVDNSYEFLVYPWINGQTDEYDIRIPSVRTNIIQFCQEFVGDDVGFDGIHFDYEFWSQSYKDSYLTLLQDIKDTIPSTKYLSVDITSAWLDAGWNNYVHEIADISDEIVFMAYVSSREYETYAKWVMDYTDEMFNQAEGTSSQVIIGVTLSKYVDNINVFKGERFDYGLVGALMGARKNGRSQVNIAIWDEWEANLEDWRIFNAIWEPVRTMDVYIYSPVDLHLYDSLGRHVGLNYDTGEIDNEIPGVYYSGPDTEPQRISITNPTDEDYSIVLVGTDQGTYHMKIEGYISDTLVHSEMIEGDTNIGEIRNFGVTIPIEYPFDLMVNVDNSPPITEKTINGPKYGENDEWVTSTTEFNLTATDDLSGVEAIHYRIWYNGEWTPWNEYTDNFTLTGEGTHYLEYYSVDIAGNVEVTHNQTHYVDDSAPIVTISASPNRFWRQEHNYMKNVLISGSATDAGSGIVSITFTVVDEYDRVEPTITQFGQTIQLEAWRNRNDMDGRMYTITATATDNLEHVATASTLVIATGAGMFMYMTGYD